MGRTIENSQSTITYIWQTAERNAAITFETADTKKLKLFRPMLVNIFKNVKTVRQD